MRKTISLIVFLFSILPNIEAKNEHNGYEYVDLGLSVRWATCNVGASTPEGYGHYFAWGETTSKSTYSWSTYKWCRGSYDTQIKYCSNSRYGTVDNKKQLDMSDDAARANWGGNWRMPTETEIGELLEKCTWVWTTQNGVNGYQVTSESNGNSIFLPAAGRLEGSSNSRAGSYGYYWSSSPRTFSDETATVSFAADEYDEDEGFSSAIFEGDFSELYGFNNFWGGTTDRFIGLSVRPVLGNDDITTNYLEEEVIYTVVEHMPEYSGGNQAMIDYINDNMRYPTDAQNNGIQGRAICQFVINKDGRVVDVHVVRSTGNSSLDNEAIRLISSMPKWKPGMHRGKPVRVKYTLPVSFRLH